MNSLSARTERRANIETDQSTLSQELLYPARGEVEKILQGLKGKKRKSSRG
jgi:hypothetical protein